MTNPTHTLESALRTTLTEHNCGVEFTDERLTSALAAAARTWLHSQREAVAEALHDHHSVVTKLNMKGLLCHPCKDDARIAITTLTSNQEGE